MMTNMLEPITLTPYHELFAEWTSVVGILHDQAPFMILGIMLPHMPQARVSRLGRIAYKFHTLIRAQVVENVKSDKVRMRTLFRVKLHILPFSPPRYPNNLATNVAGPMTFAR